MADYSRGFRKGRRAHVRGLSPGRSLQSGQNFLSLTPRPTFLLKLEFKPHLSSIFPLLERYFRSYLPLMPLAVEQFDFSEYDLILSSSHAVAMGAITRADQLHISYVHTPIRYAWDLQHQYLRQAGLSRGIKSAITRLILHYLEGYGPWRHPTG